MHLTETLRVIHHAQDIWKDMSPMRRFALIEKLPYHENKIERTNQCIRYIADNIDEFTGQEDEALVEDTGSMPPIDYEDLRKVYLEKHKVDLDDVTKRDKNASHFDFWHFLLDRFESVPWRETSSERTKTVVLDRDSIPEAVTFTEQQKENVYKRLAHQAGLTELPEDAMIAVSEMLKQKEEASSVAEKVIENILADFHGPIQIIMTVSR